VRVRDARGAGYRPILSHNKYLHELLETLEKELRFDRTIKNDRAITSQITREFCASKLKESLKEK